MVSFATGLLAVPAGWTSCTNNDAAERSGLQSVDLAGDQRAGRGTASSANSSSPWAATRASLATATFRRSQLKLSADVETRSPAVAHVRESVGLFGQLALACPAVADQQHALALFGTGDPPGPPGGPEVSSGCQISAAARNYPGWNCGGSPSRVLPSRIVRQHQASLGVEDDETGRCSCSETCVTRDIYYAVRTVQRVPPWSRCGRARPSEAQGARCSSSFADGAVSPPAERAPRSRGWRAGSYVQLYVDLHSVSFWFNRKAALLAQRLRILTQRNIAMMDQQRLAKLCVFLKTRRESLG